MDFRDELWQRQYGANETVYDGFLRVAQEIAGNDEQKFHRYFNAMWENRFIPGGRILAGAGTDHGNLLNCYVLDGSPEHPGTTEYVMALAKKLALTTKVGGGCGLNLNNIMSKRPYPHTVGRVFVQIYDDHPDYEKVRTGTYYDQVRGEHVVKGYHTVRFTDSIITSGDITVLTVPDSIVGIWDTAALMVYHIQQGADVYVKLDRLRPEGSKVNGSGGLSSGPASFAVEIFDNFARWASLGGATHAGPVATLRYVYAPTLRVVRQGGTRRGAGMATLSVGHPDIRDFITCKDLDREKVEGDISTFNISVLVSDEFMDDAIQVNNTMDRDLLREIAEHAWQTGEPGLLFVDTINRRNPLYEIDGPINATNPCGEIGLYPGEPCCLGAVNLSAFVNEHGDMDELLLRSTVRTAVEFLDDVLDKQRNPLPEMDRMIQRNRRIGLGIMGLADYLIKRGIVYGSDLAVQEAVQLSNLITRVAIETSEELAREKGEPEGCRLAREAGRWVIPRRNIALTTVAPTGTTSMIADVSSGIEPVFARKYTRRIGTEYRPFDHPLSSFPAFITAADISPVQHVYMQSAWQDGMDGGYQDTFSGNSISKTINLPNHATVEDVLEAYTVAYRTECKGITVYRDGSRDLQVLTPVEDIDTIDEEDEEWWDNWELYGEASVNPEQGHQERREVVTRPTTAHGTTTKYEIGTRKIYVTVNRADDGTLLETFINLSRPSDEEATATEIVGRLVSLCAKYGIPEQEILKHISGHEDATGGIARGRGYIGSTWECLADSIRNTGHGIRQDSHKSGRCPECAGTLTYEEGCQKCYTCGYSRCGR